MSIFESPTAVQPPADEPARDDLPRRGFDPRSVQIAGIITAAIVVLGLLVSNAARPDAEARPALNSKVAPGAAAVEEAENVPSPAQPSVAPPTTAAEEPVIDEPVSPEGDAPAWPESETGSDYYADYAEPGDGKRDGHPGKGHGRWR